MAHPAILLLFFKLCLGVPLNFSIPDEIALYKEFPVPMNPETKLRIIGGTEAKDEEYPYQVLLRGFNMETSYLCGASLISPQFVLTAAHCVINSIGIYLTLGTTQVNVRRRNSIRIRRSDVRVHEDYDPFNVRNDIAILRLPTKVKMTSKMQTIRLPKISQRNPSIFEGAVGTITGWGRISDYSPHPNNALLFADVEIMDNMLCRMKFVSMKYIINESQLCTLSNKSGTCFGDSGGPLVVKESDGNYTQVGIVSFGASRCEGQMPSVYTFTGAYLSWIHQVTKIPQRN